MVASMIFVGLAIAASAVFAGDELWQEPVDIAFTASYDGSTQRYVVMLPQGFDPRKPADLVVALHGHGSDRWQFVRNDRDECRALRDAGGRSGMIYLAPDYRAKTSWMGAAAEVDMLQILDGMRKKYSLRHVIVCGGSMGGSSALTFAAMHPDRVDGVVALNGTANHVEYEGFQDAIARSFGGTKAEVPEEYRRRSAELQIERLTMPIAVTVGGRDTTVPPQSVRRLAQSLKEKCRPVLLVDRPDRGHSTDYADTTAAMQFVVDTLARLPKKPPASKLAEVPADYEVKTNIFYLSKGESQANDYEREKCRLDVYYPRNKPGFATLVWIHGGGLYSGSRALAGPMKLCPGKLLEHGVGIVSIDYRLHPKVACPVYLQDVAAGVAWAMRNIGQYGGDPSKIFVGGGSGGAYLAAMIGFDKRWLDECGVDADRIAGLIPVSGHTVTHATIRKERSIPPHQAVVDEFAPLRHVRADSPPVLLLTGDRELELLGRYEENAYFARMLKVAGNKNVTLIELKGCDHTTCNDFADAPMWDWMRKILGL